MKDKSSSVLLRSSVGWPGGHFNSLRDSSQFCDVSLVCGDGRSYPAHKVILSSHSQTLSSILAQFPASQFCLYLAGLDSRHLASLLTFIYCGEVSLSQEDIPAFLSAAQTLQVTGLREEQERVDDVDISEQEDAIKDQDNLTEENIPEIKEETPDLVSDDNKSRETEDLKIMNPLDNIEEQEQEQEEDQQWDDVKSVSFEFIKSGKSNVEGILVTHDRNYRFFKNQSNKRGTVQYYKCSESKNGCQARAVMQRLEKFDEKEGRMVTERRLVAVSPPSLHAKVHPSDNSGIEATRLVVLMKEEIVRNPSASPGSIKRHIIQTELRDKIQDEQKIEDILSAFPMKVENTLFNYRVSLVGKRPQKKTIRHSYYLE